MRADLALFVQVVPLAVGAALSPTLVVLQIGVLTGDGPVLARSWSLAAGRSAALLVITLGGTSLLAQLPDFSRGWAASPYAAAILGGAGVVLLVSAARRAAANPGAGPRPSRFSAVDAPPATMFAFGAAWLLVSASTLAMYLPALHVVSKADVGWPMRIVALGVLFCLTSVAAVAPPLSVTLYGPRVRPALVSVREWVQRHGRRVSLALRAFAGVALVAFGLWNLVQSS